MIVCVTEKPGVAGDIARLLGATSRRDGFYEGNGYRVTWTYGHLCCLKEPDDYRPEWKWWSLGSLPMLPERFGIKLIDIDNYKRQFAVIERLIADADEVINCGDAGQEGELIQRWVYQKAGCKVPVKRLWISSLTDDSIRQGFGSLRPATDFDRLYHAGLSRAIGDWLLGMNATRLYSLKYSRPGQVLSVGRVQTPTLALIVARQREIDNFVPEDFFEIKTLYRGVVFNSTHGRYKTQGDATAVIDVIKQSALTVTAVETKPGREAPPRLFDLTSLQVECNKKFGFTADDTLKTIQSLYEKKVTTYPRVDTTFLTDDIYPQVPGIMQAMSPYASLTAAVLATTPLRKSKKVFDNSKVTDHHAIIPTNADPTTVVLTREEKLVYDLVAKRFIAAFYPDCEFLTTTVMALIAGDYEFKATGKVITAEGWRVVYARDKQQSGDRPEDDDNGVMPAMTIGESGSHEPSIIKKTTQPPKPYTEGTLLRAMETAGRTVDDEQLREAMKENGIGRPSTRAAIIETLYKRKYIKRERKSITPTTAGIQLIDTIHNELLKSAKLTGLWENKLRKIERGEYEPRQFIDELRQLVSELVLTVLRDNTGHIDVEQDSAPKARHRKSTDEGADPSSRGGKRPRRRVTRVEDIECPVCHEGHLVKGRTGYGCSRYNDGCHTVFPFTTYAANLTPSQLARAIKKSQ